MLAPRARLTAALLELGFTSAATAAIMAEFGPVLVDAVMMAPPSQDAESIVRAAFGFDLQILVATAGLYEERFGVPAEAAWQSALGDLPGLRDALVLAGVGEASSGEELAAVLPGILDRLLVGGLSQALVHPLIALKIASEVERRTARYRAWSRSALLEERVLDPGVDREGYGSHLSWWGAAAEGTHLRRIFDGLVKASHKDTTHWGRVLDSLCERAVRDALSSLRGSRNQLRKAVEPVVRNYVSRRKAWKPLAGPVRFRFREPHLLLAEGDFPPRRFSVPRRAHISWLGGERSLHHDDELRVEVAGPVRVAVDTPLCSGRLEGDLAICHGTPSGPEWGFDELLEACSTPLPDSLGAGRVLDLLENLMAREGGRPARLTRVVDVLARHDGRVDDDGFGVRLALEDWDEPGPAS